MVLLARISHELEVSRLMVGSWASLAIISSMPSLIGFLDRVGLETLKGPQECGNVPMPLGYRKTVVKRKNTPLVSSVPWIRMS